MMQALAEAQAMLFRRMKDENLTVTKAHQAVAADQVLVVLLLLLLLLSCESV